MDLAKDEEAPSEERGTADRKIVYTPGTLLDALNEGWLFDPWLNPTGRPIHIGDIDYKGVHPDEKQATLQIYWILVKGSPDQIKELEPFVKFEEEAEPEPEFKPYGLKTEYIPYDAHGKPSREPPEGFVIMHKDHIYAKGTVYTKVPE